MTLTRCFRLAVLLLVLGGTVGCDQTTKHLARKTLDPFDTITLMGGLGELRLAENPGAFLSLGASLSPLVRVACFNFGVGLGLALMLFHLIRRPHWRWATFSGLALVLAGGTSNLIDRITRAGNVTDFITVRLGPLQTGIFNIADVIIMIGIGLLIFAAIRQQRSVSKPTNPAD